MSPRKGGPRIERRRSVRADASLSMRVEGQPQGGELTKIVTESQNISASGVYCTSPHYLAPLSKVALTIILPSRGTTTSLPRPRRLLKCDGIVVRCQPGDGGPSRQNGYRLACSFVGLDPRHRDVIEEFVSWRNLEAMGRALASRPRGSTGRRKAAPGTPSTNGRPAARPASPRTSRAGRTKSR